jgi:nitroreductase
MRKYFMNLVIENIKKRHSVRLFEQKTIPKNIIKTIIEAGNLAPSTGNTKVIEEEGQKKCVIDYQPWRFVVVEDPELKQKLFQTIEPLRSNFYEGLKKTVPEMFNQAMMLTEAMDNPKDLIFYSAPVIIYVIGPSSNSIGCAMVCENIMLAAVSFGLGSCYVGFGAMVKGNDDVVKTLELTKKERIYGPIIIGYPKANPSERQATILSELRSKKKEPKIKWV